MILAFTIPPEGAPSLRFLRGGRRCCVCNLILLWHVIKATWHRHSDARPFAKNAKERGTHRVGNARNIKTRAIPLSDVHSEVPW